MWEHWVLYLKGVMWEHWVHMLTCTGTWFLARARGRRRSNRARVYRRCGRHWRSACIEVPTFVLKSEFHVLAHGENPHCEDKGWKPRLAERGRAREQIGRLELGDVNRDHHDCERGDDAVDGDFVGEESLTED